MSTAAPYAEKSGPTPPWAFILRWFPHPSETFIYEEVSALWRRGVPAALYTLYGPWRGPLSPELSAQGHAIHRLGVRAAGLLLRDILYWQKAHGPAAHRLWREVPWRKWSDWEMAGENLWAFLCGFSIARQAREKGIEHLHAPWANGPATAAWVASRLTGIPFSFSAWAGDIFPPDGALSEKIRDAAFVRSTCRSFVAHLRQQAGPHADKIHVIYSGQDPTRFAPVEVLRRPPVRLLALGRFVSKKGFSHALYAGAYLKRAGINFSLTLAGDGPEASRLKRLALGLGLEAHVAFPGFIPRHQTASLFQNSDIFLMPSIVDPAGDRDGIPTVILEALLHRLPVIASDTGGIAEVIRDGDTGRLVPPGDAAALAAAVQDLARHPKTARTIAERGRQLVLRDFNLHANTQKLLQLIERYSQRRNE